MRSWSILAAVAAAALSVTASAQPTRLEVAPASLWKHDATGVTFPPTIGGLQRNAVTAYVADELDVSPNYANSDDTEVVTFFLYRNVSGSVPVWFDRARNVVTLLPDKYLNAKSHGVRAFAPRGQQAETGLIESFAAEGRFRSTAVILFPVNGFYVKVRASSVSRDPQALEQWVLSAINALDWSSREQAPVAKPVQDCPAPLPRREPAELAELSKDERLRSALIGGAVAQAAALKARPARVETCREPRPPQRAYGIYRPVGTDDRYLIAITDAGRAISVGGEDLSQILAETSKQPLVPISHIDLHETSTFGHFKTTPSPEQVMALVQDSSPLSVAKTWGTGDRSITINDVE